MEGRNYLLPDDVKELGFAVLAHRIVLDVGAELRGRNSTQVIQDIMAEIEVPIEPEG